MGDSRVSEDATARRRQLGRFLRQARESAGVIQTRAAKELGCGQAKINKIEKTLVKIGREELDKLIRLYGVPEDEAAKLRELAALDQRDSPERTKHTNTLTAFGELIERELEAREIRCWHSERIPGPLQSQMYVLTMYEAEFAAGKANVTRVLREWEARRNVFTVDNPPRYLVILSESALRRMPGGGAATQLRVDQAEYLLTLMDRYEQLDVRILTFDAEIPYVDSDFQHLEFLGEEPCEFFYIEYPGGSRKCKAAHELEECRKHWTALLEAALDRAQSREFLNRLAGRDELSAL